MGWSLELGGVGRTLVRAPALHAAIRRRLRPARPASLRRDFPESQLVVLNKIQSAAAGDAAAHRLNPWQVEHAKLVVLAVKEVNELRFVLCPRRAAWHWLVASGLWMRRRRCVCVCGC